LEGDIFVPDEVWRQIVEVHNRAKELFILAEEMDRRFETFLQPVQELKHALEHIVRARARELGITGNPDSDYVDESLRKAFGHEYRAFFDVADWLGVALREKAIDQMSRYSPACISRYFREWYEMLRPKLETANIEIAKFRTAKDVAKGGDVIPEVEKYHHQIVELAEMMPTISSHVPQLEEGRRQERRDQIKSVLWQVGLVVLGAGLTILGEWLYRRFVGG
jgi:hypothetical protein